uniref:Cyclin dependent kinase 2 associated protein 2 n=1 Tax=Fundulus heteroclitus TaxID=8078 RepID=A0A3Q2P4Q4_FUNHE
MSYKPIAPAPSGSNHTPPGSSVPSPSLPSSSNFRPAFSDFGPPSMGFVQPVKVSQGSTYSELLSVIEEMSREIRPTYAGSKSAMERLKRGTLCLSDIHHVGGRHQRSLPLQFHRVFNLRKEV